MSRRDRFDQCNLQQLVHTHAKVIANDCVYLSLSTFLQGLAREDLQELAQSARARRVSKGEFFFHQGQPAPEVYMLTSGAVKIVRVDADGRSVVLRLVKLMEPFAERGFLGGTTRLASAQALEDSRALVWDAPVIDQIIVRNPVVALNNIRMLAEMVETERKRLEDFAGPSVERRLARLLMRLAQSIGHKADGGLALEISLSRQDLAELVITTPFTISRILADWRRLDIADALGERIVIRSPQRMAAIADMHIAEDLVELREGNRALER